MTWAAGGLGLLVWACAAAAVRAQQVPADTAQAIPADRAVAAADSLGAAVPGMLQAVLSTPSFYPWMVALLVVLLAFIGVGAGWRFVQAERRKAGRYQHLFERAGEAMILTDSDLRLLEVNPAAHRLLTEVRKVLRFQPLGELLQTTDRIDPARLIEQVEEVGKAVFDARVPRKSGGEVEVHVIASRVETEGQPRWLFVAQDVTESRERFRRFESFLERLIDDAPIQVVIYSPDGKYQYVNPQVVENEQVRAWLIGKTDFEYCQEFGLHMEVALRRRSHRKQVVESKEPVYFEEPITLRTGEERHFMRLFSPHLDPSGEVAMVFGFGMEDTQLKKYQGEVVAAREEVQRTARLKTAFLQNISHEFRTPLTGMLGLAQVLKEEAPDDLREFAEGIEHSSQRLMDTLNGLLDMAGLQAENVELDPQIVNLVQEAREVGQQLQREAEAKQLFLRVSASTPEVLAHLDQASLRRVLHSLIGNAVKFTRQGGVLVEVARDARYGYVRVMDSGVGISSEFIPSVFEAFNQEELGMDRSFEGMGLGLTITQRLVSILGGEITVHSEKGEGSMFSVRFPLAFAGDEGAPKPRVLFADRDREAHRLLQYMVGDYYRITAVATLTEAVDCAGRERFDVILADVGLEEGVPAAELLQHFRQVPGYDRTPVMAVDTSSAPGSGHPYTRAGYDAHVAKPFKKLGLLNVLAGQRKRRSTVA